MQEADPLQAFQIVQS